MKDALPVLLLLGIGAGAYFFFKSRAATVAGGDTAVAATNPFNAPAFSTQVAAAIANPTLTQRSVIPPGAATIFGTYGSGLDVIGTGYQQDVIDYARTVSAFPTAYFAENTDSLRELRNSELNTAIPGNTQLIKASYERAWADKISRVKLPYGEWNRLRAQYVNQYGGDSDAPWLDMILGSTQKDVLMSAPQYLDYVNQYRARTGKSNLGFLGCGRSCHCGCEKQQEVWA